MITVNKDTQLVTSALQSVTFNGATQSTSGDTLGTVNLYKQNVIEFMTLTSSSVVFNFNIAQIHKKILVRARVFTECSSGNITARMRLAGATNEEFTATPSAGSESILEGSVLHTGSTFALTLEYGLQTEPCRKMVQDIAVYF